MATPIRILIADDHSIVRAGLRTLLGEQPEIEVVGEAPSGATAIELYTKLLPDVALIDLRMPVLDGLEATRAIIQRHPEARILIQSTYEGDENVFRALEAGAMGYLLKTAPSSQLLPAIQAVMAGHQWLPSELKKQLAERLLKEPLSVREVEVLSKVAAGESNKELAAILGITEHTAKAHLKNILGKLGVRDRTEAVTVALARGIIRLERYQS